jgi:ubiquinone/menaquinone biosynthesis C-methylase UbiE
MSDIASVVLTIVGVSVVLAQCRKPMGWPGRFFAWLMNRSHSSLTDWGLTHVVIGKRDTALDVGCGGGRTVQKLATIATDGKVCGIDYSEASVRTSRSANRQAIQAGRVEIQRASVSQLPFPDGMFDLVTAVETHYYWPDLTADMREILRVLKPGGKLLMIAEAYKGSRYDIVYGV